MVVRGPPSAASVAPRERYRESCQRMCTVLRWAEGLFPVVLVEQRLLAGGVSVAAEPLGAMEHPCMAVLGMNE